MYLLFSKYLISVYCVRFVLGVLDIKESKVLDFVVREFVV